MLGLEVVTPGGRRYGTACALKKDNTGYDLRDLYLGAEGTLESSPAQSPKLWPRAPTAATAWIAALARGRRRSVLSGAHAASEDNVTSCELMSRRGHRSGAEAHSQARRTRWPNATRMVR